MEIMTTNTDRERAWRTIDLELQWLTNAARSKIKYDPSHFTKAQENVREG